MTTSLHDERLDRVVSALLEKNARSVLDLGCGPGELLYRLAAQSQFSKIVGIDTSREALSAARHLMAQEEKAGRLSLYHESFTSFIEDFIGFDAAVMVETIEHIDPQRLSSVEKTVFGGYRPEIIIITTPNSEFNVLHGLPEGVFRHPDHFFEWSRARFRKWAEGVAGRTGYRIEFSDIGPVDPALGSSTQMATFSLVEQPQRRYDAI